MIYSQIENYSLGTGDMQNVMDSLQPHVSLTERVQKLCKMYCILINQSPERLFCRPGQTLHEDTILLARHWKSSLMLLTAKFLWLLKGSLVFLFQYLKLLLETPLWEGESIIRKGFHREIVRGSNSWALMW